MFKKIRPKPDSFNLGQSEEMTCYYFLNCRVSGSQGLSGICPGGVNICEHLVLLGETDSKERVNSPSHTDGLFRATLFEHDAFSTRHASLARPDLCISEP